MTEDGKKEFLKFLFNILDSKHTQNLCMAHNFVHLRICVFYFVRTLRNHPMITYVIFWKKNKTPATVILAFLFLVKFELSIVPRPEFHAESEYCTSLLRK